MLAVHAGRLITTPQLVDELWPDDPPRSAVANLRTYAASLRRTFRSAGAAEGSLVREGDGYRLSIDKVSVDVVRVVQGHAEARELIRAGRPEKAVEVLTRALRSWHHPLLAGVRVGPLLSARREAVAQERLAAIELLTELHIKSGRSDLALLLLRPEAGEQPVRERLQALLMRALVETDDLAGARAVYDETRRALEDQLGVTPGAELEQLYRSIMEGRRAQSPLALSRDGLLAAPAAGGRTAGAAAWLPRSITDFVGRTGVIGALLRDIDRSRSSAPVVRVIDGMAGCGKTTLAVHLARLLLPQYPDAQLFIDLRGHGGATPLSPAVALLTLLRQLGVPAGRIPTDLEGRIELWRRELSRGRVIIILDNAADSQQIIPLMPTEVGSVVLVTTRRKLFMPEAGPPESLAVLTPAEAVELLAVTAGRERVAAEPAAAAEVVRFCGHLPLAIRLAGARLAHRGAWRVADLARQLSSGRGAIDHLAVEDRTVAGAFAASYQPLSRKTKCTFRMIALHPGSDFSLPMAAALADLPLDETSDSLDELLDRHLLEEVGDGRFRLHDLMRRYASELSQQVDPPSVRTEAADRLLDLCVRAALVVAETLEPRPASLQLLPGLPPRPDLIEELGPLGVEWLERERLNLTMMVRFAESAGRDEYAWRLARAIWRFCYMRSYFDDILTTHQFGLAAAERSGDRAAVALMQNYLASAYVRTSNYPMAQRLVESAIAAYTALGDAQNLARFRGNLSAIYWLTGEIGAAIRLSRALVEEEKREPALDLTLILPNLGIALCVAGRYQESLEVHRLHLWLSRVRADDFHRLNALAHLGTVKIRLGQFESAVRLLRASLNLRRRTGHRYGEPEVRADLGAALRGLGQLREARHEHETALELARDYGERHAECVALNELGRTLEAEGGAESALRAHQQALKLATRIDHRFEQGRALAGIAELVAATHSDEARRHWLRSLAIFERMGVPERFEVQRRLDQFPTRR